MLQKLLLILIGFTLTSPLSAGQLRKQAKATFKPIPHKAPKLDGNKATRAKLELGRMLFVDPRLSSSQLISCNSCHNIGLAGADLQKTSIGHGWQKGPRNAPTTMNSVFHIAQFWDGRAKDLEAQAKGPVQAGVEMNNTPAVVEATLKSMPAYVKLFKRSFPKDKNPVSFDNMAKAIAVFEATLITPNSKFDKFLKGKTRLSKRESAGLTLFMDKGCSSCHGGLNVGGEQFHKFGMRNAPSDLVRPPADEGKKNVTGKEEDKYVFRVPTLRNIALTGPYFHSGAVSDLREAVKIMGKTQLNLDLSEKEVTQIVAFLKTLNGVQPRVAYPVLPGSTATTPAPKP